MIDWRLHYGKACPTDEQATVRCRYRGVNGNSFESKAEYYAGRLRWSHKGEPGDIVEYLVTSVPREDE